MTASRHERVIEARARTQHGAFSHRQARAAGFSAAMVRRRLDRGRWEEVDQGVYAIAGTPASADRQVMAATLAVPGGAACRTTAATLHGFTGFRLGRLHVVTGPSEQHRSRIAVVHRSKLAEVTRVRGIPVVTPAHCIIELAGVVAAERVRAALHDAVAADPRLLAALVHRYVGLARSRLPGIGTIRALIDELAVREHRPTETELERLLVSLLLAVPGMPEVVVQAPLPWRPRGQERVDVLIPEWRLIAEADGRPWHTRVDDFVRDRERDNEAAVHGFHVMRFAHHQLAVRRSDSIDQLIRFGERVTGGPLGVAIVPSTQADARPGHPSSTRAAS